jgi:hypothetical protein
MSIRVKISLTFAFLFLSMCADRAFAQSNGLANPQAEQYVLEQLAAGTVADLGQKFPNENDRLIRASFLEELVINSTGKFAIHRNGIQIQGAVISEPVQLSNVEITQLVDLSRCRFKGVVEFSQSTFKKGLLIVETVFDGPAFFGSTTIVGILSAKGVQFNDVGSGAHFEVIKVNGPAIFSHATFKGKVTFLYGVIDGVFQVDDASFTDKDEEVIFDSMRIDRGFFAARATFEGPVDLVNMRIGDNFDGPEAHFNNPVKDVSFERMSVGANLFLESATFAGPVSFTNTNVAGNVELKGTQFKQTPDLSNFTYQSIVPTSEVLKLLRNSESNYTAYSALESSLQKNGYTSEGDDVFIEKKRWERRRDARWFEKLKSYLSEGLQGFGRKPHRVLYYDLGVVLFGAFLFRRRKMILKPAGTENKEDSKQETTGTTRPYNAFLYSLTLFAPAIDSQYTNNWELESGHGKTRGYVQLHKILGYILVPLTIAIWSGIFK